jgi:hypothetical protein
MAGATRDGDGHDGGIRLRQEDDRWIARDVATGEQEPPDVPD